jgi:hypothetical protein
MKALVMTLVAAGAAVSLTPASAQVGYPGSYGRYATPYRAAGCSTGNCTSGLCGCRPGDCEAGLCGPGCDHALCGDGSCSGGNCSTGNCTGAGQAYRPAYGSRWDARRPLSARPFSSPALGTGLSYNPYRASRPYSTDFRARPLAADYGLSRANW